MGTVFEALADPSRRKMLSMLARQDLPAGAIARAFDMTKPSVSHHLSVLKAAGLVEARRSGQSIVYSIDTTVLEDAIAGFMDMIKVGERAEGEDQHDDAN
jgi:ArsR family transcriptional regulator, arsenate/arsenite/antimonite-responsive transcriptional repressor